MQSSGASGIIKGVERVSKSVAVYNFEVEGNHNYYVGEGGYLVHNSCAAGAIELGTGHGANIGNIIGGTLVVGGAIGLGIGAGIAIKESIALSKDKDDWTTSTFKTYGADIVK